MTSTKDSYRWIILGLLFFATTLNYIDRIILSVLIPNIKTDLGITDIDYSHILSAFQLAYTLGFLFAGNAIDRLGTKLGYLLAMFLWSVCAGLHALCGTAFCLSFWRALLGVTESANFPAAIKSVAEWFPIKERAFATSLFNSGSSISSIIGPPVIAAIALAADWRWAFAAFGLAGVLPAVVWPTVYKNPSAPAPPKTSAGETRVPWSQLVRERKTIGIMAGKFLTDPVWWFYLYWMPNYLSEQRGFDLKNIAIAIPLIYILATLIGIVFGWLPACFMGRGWSVGRARKTTMLLTALLLPVSATAVFAANPWVAIILVSLACGAHNGWSANIFTLVSDCFPQRKVGAITGLAGFAGGVGGLLIATLAPGYIVTWFGYVPIFILMGVLHPLAFVAIKWLVRDEDIGRTQ